MKCLAMRRNSHFTITYAARYSAEMVMSAGQNPGHVRVTMMMINIAHRMIPNIVSDASGLKTR